MIIDGVPAGVKIDEALIQRDLDRRRPGQSKVSTMRKEPDRVEILSGVFEGVSTGTSLAMVIRNTDQRSQDYGRLAELFRPGHADLGFFKKYGVRDYRGGGRSSGRETSMRVAAGAVAKMVLATMGVSVRACSMMIGGVYAETVDWSVVEENIVRSPDLAAAEKMVAAIRAAQADRDSVGGIICCEAHGVPAGWGEPVFDSSMRCWRTRSFPSAASRESKSAPVSRLRKNAAAKTMIRFCRPVSRRTMPAAFWAASPTAT